jgi:GDP-L-fucose synthase
MAKVINFESEIIWDPSKPNAQPGRMLDVSRAEKEFGFKSNTSFEKDLKKTIEWYISAKEIR